MNRQHGFTIVELVITITVSALLASSIFQLIASSNNLAIEASRRSVASNLAYNNMRKYANNKKPLWFDCVGDEASETTPPFSDGKTKPAATGQVLINTTSNTPYNLLPPPVTQYVIGIAPYGCGTSGPGQPIRVQSQVTYGSGTSQRTLTHATYVSY